MKGIHRQGRLRCAARAGGSLDDGFAAPAATHAESGGSTLFNPGTTGTTGSSGTTGPTSTSPSGGTNYSGGPRPASRRGDQRRRAGRPVLASFQVSKTAWSRPAPAPTVTYQVNDRSRYVRVRLALVQLGHGALLSLQPRPQAHGDATDFNLGAADARKMTPQGSTSSASPRVDPDGNRLVRSSRTSPERLRSRNRQRSVSRSPLPGRRRARLRRPDARFGAAAHRPHPPGPGHQPRRRGRPSSRHTPA